MECQVSRAEAAERIGRWVGADLRDGWYVNVGIGLPSEIPGFVDPPREVIFHTENGIFGVGPRPGSAEVDPTLVDAGKQPVTVLSGGAIVDHVSSFAAIRGGHLDVAVLGAYEVSIAGDFANWKRDGRDDVPAVGGAMDLAVGAKRVWLAMRLFDAGGRCRVVERCSYPLTAVGVVRRVYTEWCVLDLHGGRPHLRERHSDIQVDRLRQVIPALDCQRMDDRKHRVPAGGYG